MVAAVRGVAGGGAVRVVAGGGAVRGVAGGGAGGRRILNPCKNKLYRRFKQCRYFDFRFDSKRLAYPLGIFVRFVGNSICLDFGVTTAVKRFVITQHVQRMLSQKWNP